VGCRQHVPVWHEATREWVKQGRLVLLGVTQEQHADRCRLFAQWKRFDWPILHDPINLMEVPAVPIVVAIDEHGIVRATRPRPETLAAEFLDRTFADDAPPGASRATGPPDPASLLRKAGASPDADAWRAVGDALTIWGGAGKLDDAIDAYSRALKRDPSDKNALFRLGVAHRMRHESAGRRPGDFQAALDAWGRALELDPNQYIWRRRIEQYGPRLAKPYAFYDWVVQARAEITRRGERPVPLVLEPYGSEIAGPVREVLAEEKVPVEPDPGGRVHRDEARIIEAEVAVAPARVRPGRAARVHIAFRPNPAHTGHWNNESTPLRVWVVGAEGWTIATRLLEAPQGDQPESEEVRRLDFEVKSPSTAAGKTRLAAYALYNTCEQAGGRCLFLRQDLTIELDVAK
jgi:tetratricopeptide (TPR) repeat protein